MNFQPLDYADYRLISLALIGGAVVAFLLLLWGVKVAFLNKKMTAPVKRTLIAVAILGTIAVGIIAGSIGAMLGNSAIAANKFRTTQNIMQKYDVSDVQWDNKQTTASPIADKSASGNTIVITASNKKTYVFAYELNTATSEPTLTEIPGSKNSDDTDTLTAKDLLKK